MKARKSHIIPSFLLAVLLLFGNAPKEFIHSFTGHKDTVHTAHRDGELSFDPHHHHCDFLSYALPLFIAATPAVVHFSVVIAYPPVYEEEQAKIFHKVAEATFLRGPPETA